ncbi:MAG: T9SS type A sorting domain-containing protein [Fidelibacterota bacterium]|nr:MAG: T9SS type A sorting domain-containing protein [Candidatus Neomarinimicrobiota bacterium]
MPERTPRIMRGFFTFLVIFPACVLAKGNWGWQTHEYINFHAVEYLPPEMSFFLYQRTFLYQHASDPDQDGSPGYYHYIDIDYYREFYLGTLPHEWEEMLDLYDETVVREVGIVPWVIQWWTDSLSVLMSRHEWANAWQIAANLGHYVADSHQPLHLTLNYNGQFSGNDGIHSRYETQLIGPRLGSLPLPEGEAVYWDNVIDSVFGYIGEAYSNITWILVADNLARSQDPSYGSTYYEAMWTNLDTLTTRMIQREILDLASIWYTAWVNAGEPVPSLGIKAVRDEDLTPDHYTLYPNYPNPFNPTTTIRYANPVPGNVVLRIFDTMGREVYTILGGFQPAGVYKVVWDGRDHHHIPLGAGVYFCRLEAGNVTRTIKMLLLK